MRLRKTLLPVLLSGAGLGALGTGAASAEDEPYIGEIAYTAASYCARGWAEASGQILPISENTALFSLLGCQFGGDCRSTFALPDLRGRAKTGPDDGAPIGTPSGVPQTTLTVANMPAHTHSRRAAERTGTLGNPAGNDLAEFSEGDVYSDDPPNMHTLADAVVGTTGSSAQTFQTYQPTLVMRACVALEGIYPSRN